jgi:hypothetical protein
MPTVHQQTHSYCEKHNLPVPLPADLSRIGTQVSFYFRKSWAPNQTKEIVGEARFVFSHERKDCKPFIIVDYPASFSSEINKIISHFYHTKETPEVKETPPVKRTRKPVIKPEISVKPTDK